MIIETAKTVPTGPAAILDDTVAFSGVVLPDVMSKFKRDRDMRKMWVFLDNYAQNCLL